MIPKYLERLLSEPDIFRKIIYQFSLSGILKKILLNKSKDLNLNISTGKLCDLILELKNDKNILEDLDIYLNKKQEIIKQYLGKSQKVSTDEELKIIKENSISTDIDLRSIAISLDGKYIITGTEKEFVRIWDFSNGDLVRTLGKGVFVGITPNNKYVLSGSFDDKLRVWELISGKGILEIDGGDIIAISPNGKLCATSDDKGRVKIINLERKNLLKEINPNSQYIESIIFSLDDNYIITGSDADSIEVWELKKGKLIRTLVHSGSIFLLAISNDGKYLASGSSNNTIKIWELNTGTLILTLKEDNKKKEEKMGWWQYPEEKLIYHTEGLYVPKRADLQDLEKEGGDDLGLFFSVNALVFSYNGQYIIGGFDNGTIKIWRISTQKVVNILTENVRPVITLIFTDDGRYLTSAYSDGTIVTWRFESALTELDSIPTISKPKDEELVKSDKSDKPEELEELESQIQPPIQTSAPLFEVQTEFKPTPTKSLINLDNPEIKLPKGFSRIFNDIGRAGEICFFSKILPFELLSLYPDAELIETEDGWRLIEKEMVKANVIWNNINGESKINHDFRLIIDETIYYIEVKATITNDDTFTISLNELNFAKENNINYIIYQIVNLGKNNEMYVKYKDFYRSYKAGSFTKKSIILKPNSKHLNYS